jgi:hypothetical protein
VIAIEKIRTRPDVFDLSLSARVSAKGYYGVLTENEHFAEPAPTTIFEMVESQHH